MNVSGILSHHLQVEVMAPSRGNIMLCRIWISYSSAYPNRITLINSYSLCAGVIQMTTEFFRIVEATPMLLQPCTRRLPFVYA